MLAAAPHLRLVKTSLSGDLIVLEMHEMSISAPFLLSNVMSTISYGSTDGIQVV